MRLMTPLAATAALMLAAPVMAQDAPVAPPVIAAAPAPEPAKSAEELALEADAAVFQTTMQTMSADIGNAMVAAAGDAAKATADVDVVLARYEPQIEAFAVKVETFLAAQAAASTVEAEKTALAAASAQASLGLRSIPAQVRASVLAQMTAPAAAPAAPEAPAVPQ